ncbi:MAG: glycosyltransferase family 87 protein [Ignavibacteria bacterium]|nr:glycosyltransferase family 87 protein [Ignavibacteria bacterium]
MTGFGIALMCFFFIPVFFTPAHRMIFPGTFMAADIIGNDLRIIVLYASSFFKDGVSPYASEYYYYPPFTVFFFAPLSMFPHIGAFILISLVTFILYLMYLAFYALRFSGNKFFTPLLIFFIVTGLLSYGFQFEIERGQFNIIAVVLCITAIYFFHYKPKLRILAYVLFVLSVQLKIYPAIFILLLVDDWHELKVNIKRFAILAVVNILLLFILGTGIFSDFFNNVCYYSVNPISWTGNHSISSFITLVTQKSVERLGMTQLAWTAPFAPAARIILLAVYLITLFYVITRIYKRSEKGFNNLLFFVCMIGALIIPSVSHDYKLALLTLPVFLLFNDFENLWNAGKDTAGKVLIIFASFLYSSLLFSYTTKPVYLSNNFPFLFLLLFVMIYLNSNLRKKSVQPRI